MKKKILIILVVIGVTLILTNPTPSDFQTYIEGKWLVKKADKDVGCGRTSNYLIFSIYSVNDESDDKNIQSEFYGVFKNFYIKSVRGTEILSRYENGDIKSKTIYTGY